MDEKFLRPNREHLIYLNGLMAAAEREMVQKIERWGKDDKEYAEQQTREYYAKIEPLRREHDAVMKLIVDYYQLQSPTSMVISAEQITGIPKSPAPSPR